MSNNSSNSSAIVLPVYGEECLDRESLSESSSVFVFALVLVLTVNLFLLLVAVVGNALIMRVFHRVVSIHPSSRALFYSLAASDLCVGSIVQPLNIVFLISNLTGNITLCRGIMPYREVLGFAMCGVSLLTASEISLDRLFALRLRLSYRRVVSLGRARLVVVITWFVSLISGLTSLWNREAFNVLQIVGAFLSITVSTVSYSWIYHNLRQRAIRVHDHRQTAGWSEPCQSVSEASSFSRMRYKKTLSTAQWVYFVLLLCSLPYMIVAALWTVLGGNREIIIGHAFALTLVYFNSAFNPLLYCLKIAEVRYGIKGLFRRGVSCNR